MSHLSSLTSQSHPSPLTSSTPNNPPPIVVYDWYEHPSS